MAQLTSGTLKPSFEARGRQVTVELKTSFHLPCLLATIPDVSNRTLSLNYPIGEERPLRVTFVGTICCLDYIDLFE